MLRLTLPVDAEHDLPVAGMQVQEHRGTYQILR